MASTNQSPQYLKAQSMFFLAKTNEERLKWLEEMMKESPKHKSSEKMNANLKTRYIKLKDKIDRLKKSGKASAKTGIKKEDMQAVIVGFTNSGKSSLLSSLTNASPSISQYDLTTKYPIVGITDYLGTKIQIIEIPAFNSEYYDKGLANTADVILVLVTEIGQIKDMEQGLEKSDGKRIIVFNKIDTLTESEIRKVSATLSSKKYNFVLVSAKTGEGLLVLKEKLFQAFGKMRIFTKEPGKQKSEKPFVLEKNSTVQNVAKKVLKNLSVLKETRIWGPSSKFPGQIVGLHHVLKDMDIIEFKTR
ncbi:MAG: GTPase [Nanoarchaeota archaeon]